MSFAWHKSCLHGPRSAKLAVALAALVAVLGLSAVSAHSAFACVNTSQYFGNSGGDSSNYADTCGNFNVNPQSDNSHYIGWYRSNNGVWHAGSGSDYPDGQWITVGNWGSPPLITGLISGTTVHAQECNGCTAPIQKVLIAVF
jgi:hypothetical protein